MFILESKGSFKNLNEAEQWAKQNLQGKSFVNKFTDEPISISGRSITEMLNPNTTKKIGEQIHIAALMSVPEFIETGIPAEQHRDTHGRDFDVIRLYNAITIDDDIYRVKSTIKKFKEGDRYYTYELQEMELIEDTQLTADGLNGNPVLNSINSISGANLLKGVKKTNSNEDILNASKVVDENGEPKVVFHGSSFRPLSEDGVFTPNDGALGKGIYFTSAFPEAADYAREKLGDTELSEDEIYDNGYITEAFLNITDTDNIIPSHYGNGEYIYLAENPNQIKSATDNTGEFSAENDDIRFSIDSDGISEDNLLQHQQELSKVDKIINTWRSQGKSIPEVFWKERGKIIKNFLDEIGTEPVTMVTRSNFEQVMRNNGCDADLIDDIKVRLESEEIPGLYLQGYIYMFANDVIDINDALTAYIHERQHLVTHQDFRNNVNHVLSRAESLEELQNAVVAMSGNEDYRNLHRANLADEFISFAMALSYTNANFAHELRNIGVNEQLIRYIDEYSKSQWHQAGWANSRKKRQNNAHDGQSKSGSIGENGRDSRTESPRMGQQRLRTVPESSQTDGEREFFKSGAGTVRGWTKDGIIYLTRDGLNPETPIHEYTHIWADAVRKYNPALWSNVKSLMKRLPQWKQVVSDPNYQDIAGNEDAVASEVLARYSGKRGAKRLVQDAKQFGETTGRKGYAAQLIQRVKKVLEDFWKWVNVNLFNISEFSSAEEAADRVLYDLVSGTDLSSPTVITDNILKQNSVEGLLGNDIYNAMMNDIFAGTDIITQANMVKQGDRTAQTREYIAKVCSNVSAHQQEALQIVNAVRDAFQNKGMALNVTDTELLYKIWQENNNEPRQTLKENIIHFDKSKKVKSSIEEDFGPTTNDIKLSFAEAFKEKIVDRMHSVSVLLKTITTRGGVITPDTDPYMSENLASSRSMYEIDKFKQDLYETLLQKVTELQKLFVHTGLVKEAGNYKMGHIKINGFDITIENPKGSIRSGVDKNGSPWEVQMNNHYGYIRRTKGNDGDQIDVFVGDSPTSGKIFIVDQVDNDGKFDEHKVMMGFDSIEEAEQAYMSNYSPGWKGLGNIIEVSVEDFKEWAKDGRKKLQPFAGRQENGERSLSAEEAKTLINAMKANAEVAPEIELTPENWLNQFGESGEVETPIGKVKMGENQLSKIFLNKREREWGMILPTLSNPDIIIEEASKPRDGQTAERDSSFLFIKSFIRDGKKVKYFLSVTVKRDGLEVVISNHFTEESSVKKKLQNEKIAYIRKELFSNSSDRHLAENQNGLPDLLPTQENSSSENKDKQSLSEIQTAEQQESLERPAQTVTKRNRIVDDERYAQLRGRMRKKISQLNVGIDPEMLAIGIEMDIHWRL